MMQSQHNQPPGSIQIQIEYSPMISQARQFSQFWRDTVAYFGNTGTKIFGLVV